MDEEETRTSKLKILNPRIQKISEIQKDGNSMGN